MPRPILTAWLLCLMLWLPGAGTAQTLLITRAAVAVADASTVPPAEPPHHVTLPDDWARSRPGFTGSVWYRVGFTPPAPLPGGEPLVLLIEHVCSNLEVFLNGQLLASGGRMQMPFTHQCNHPQLVTLPAALLKPQDNVLALKVAGHALAQSASGQRAGALSGLQIGPQSLLAPRHAALIGLQVTAPQAMGATLVLLGGFLFGMGFVNRRETHLAYFGALCIGWAVLGARLWLRELPLGHTATEFLLCALMGFITWVAVQFLLRHAGQRPRWIDHALPLQCALLPLSLLAAGPARLHLLATLWFGVLALQVAAAAVWHVRCVQRTRSPWPMAALLGALGLAGAIEFAVQWAGVPVIAAQGSELGVAVLLALLGLRLVQQSGAAAPLADPAKQLLEQRVREATADIERNFRQMSDLRVEQVTERERKRIAADLHDDLGAKLLTIVHTSESERISTLAREALEEMRLSVRGLTGKPVRLADALGDWRAEVVGRLAQAGIDGSWDAPEDLPQTLSARAYVQTTRILREATSNVIKHSGAQSCSVSAGIADGDFQLIVQDDGDGISSELEGRLDRGHGLASMKNRAKQLQGQCLVESGPGYGTVIRLTVPLDRAMTPS